MLQTEDDVICIINEGQEGRFLNFHNTVEKYYVHIIILEYFNLKE